MPNCQSCDQELPRGSRFCNHCGKKQPNGPKKRRPKSANGQGSVVKLGGRRAKPWAAYTPAKYNEKIVVRPRKLIGTFATEGEARNAILARPEVANTEVYNYTVEQVYTQWKAEHFKSIGPGGQEGYIFSWANLCNPVRYKDPDTDKDEESYAISNKKARDLMKLDLQQIINALACAGKSRSKCEKVKQLMSQLCRWCVDHGLLTRNLAENLTLPASSGKEKRIFTEKEIGEIEKLLASKNSTRKQTAQIAMILCYTGFRVSALLQMRVKDVHLDENIGGQIVSYMVGGVKTDAGKNRLVPIHHRINVLVRQLVTGKTEDDLIFPTSNGTQISTSNARRDFDKMVAEIGADNVTFHSCRHTFATKHARAETRPEILRKLMGHTDYKVTQIYTHSDIAALVKANEKIV